MRIRKSASKILGSAVAFDAPPVAPPPPLAQLNASSSWASPPPPTPTAPSEWGSQAFVSAAEASGIICALNQSPWDLLLPDLDWFQENVGEGEVKVEEEDRTGSLLGNKINLEDKTVTPPLMSAFASEKKFMKMGSKSSTNKAAKKNKKDQEIDEKVVAISRKKYSTNCKKNDGKGWHCKRPAESPNTLCSYHLSQLRSYRNSASGASGCDNSSNRATATTATTPQAENIGKQQQQKKKKRKSVNADAGDYANDYYYYYSGFGPWRGKRRGAAKDIGNRSSDIDDANMQQEEEKEVAAAPAQTMARSEYIDVHNDDSPVAGDDEEDNYDEDDDGKGYDDGLKSRDDKEAEHKKMHRAKRGRKPVKARSLKSLL